MTRSSPSLSMEKAQQQQIREPPPANLTINAASSNSTHAISPNDYSDDSPGSYTSYSSADYSSIGVLNNSKINKRSTFNSNSNSSSSMSNNVVVGHGLLSEVLKMQGLLEEYQHALTALEIEKADKQQEINKLDRLLKGKGETEERYKDEIWNLELNKQELLQKIHDLSQGLHRATAEQHRLASQEATLCQEIEHFKTVQHTWESALTAAQEQHDNETLALKKSLFSVRAEKDQMAKQLQQVLAIQQEAAQHQQSGLRHVDKPASSDGEQEHAATVASTTTVPTNSLHSSNGTEGAHTKSLAVRHQAEIAALKTSLEQAHDIIKTMQVKIDEERQERTEVDTLLREAQETIEHFHQQQHQTLLQPHSPASISNRQQRSTQQQKVSSSPYLQRGKSLGDELSHAGSIGNFMASSSSSSSPVSTTSSSHAHMELTQQQQQPSLPPLQTASTITLTCVALPSITNHDTVSCFMASSSSASTTTTMTTPSVSNEEQAPPLHTATASSHHEYYGSLIREPTSYIYKSKRDNNNNNKMADKQQKSPSSFKLNFGSHDFNVDADFNRQQQQQGQGEDDDSGSSADAMTRTMIGDWMWKYTRKVVGSGISENRHRRFFWIHPYTQTLYWSTQEPGANAAGQCSTKSVLVESFMVLPPHETSRPPGIYIKSPSRGIQIQCLDFTAHYAWIKSLRYLLSDADHTQHVIPTVRKSKTGKTTLDRKKFSSLRQKNRSFTKLLDAPPSLPNSAIRCSNNNDIVGGGSKRQEKQQQQALFNNSTLIDLSIDQESFLDLNALKRQ
ncbi:hypothetical protein MBANPS3_001474 [Mucor bainieri]